jgi:hypothetical protein
MLHQQTISTGQEVKACCHLYFRTTPQNGLLILASSRHEPSGLLFAVVASMFDCGLSGDQKPALAESRQKSEGKGSNKQRKKS